MPNLRPQVNCTAVKPCCDTFGSCRYSLFPRKARKYQVSGTEVTASKSDAVNPAALCSAALKLEFFMTPLLVS